jgi:hypothetical protein
LLNFFTLDLELNTVTKTLNFFIDDQQLPYRITNITSKPLYFALSESDVMSGEVEMVSVTRPNKSTATDNSDWKHFEWKEDQHPRKRLHAHTHFLSFFLSLSRSFPLSLPLLCNM